MPSFGFVGIVKSLRLKSHDSSQNMICTSPTEPFVLNMTEISSFSYDVYQKRVSSPITVH
ncbi:hypothetical protein JB92DRAFT_2882244 [Gautieria morchelliformis]|nr:hypothetical protein JB92DRAFT_2882244 [Gautieria morchelliformis]